MCDRKKYFQHELVASNHQIFMMAKLLLPWTRGSPRQHIRKKEEEGGERIGARGRTEKGTGREGFSAKKKIAMRLGLRDA